MSHRNETTAAASTPAELPPLPAPGMPPERILAGLVAWLGGPVCAVAILAQALDTELAGAVVSDEEYDFVRPSLAGLTKWAQENPDGHAGHDAAVVRAVRRHGRTSE